MLLTKEVVLKWSNSNKDIYTAKGYVFTKIRDLFTVKIEDLSLGSSAMVELSCDYCGQLITKQYLMYNKSKKESEIKKDCCIKCLSQKIAESNLLKYGVKNTSQVSSIISKTSASLKTPYSQIKEICETKNFELLTDEYEYYNNIDKRNKVKLLCNIHCNKGEFFISVPELKSRKYNCKYCAYENVGKSRRRTIAEVKEAFDNRDYILLSTEYIDNLSKLEYICNKHAHKGTQLITWGHFVTGEGCYYCGIERRSGENNNRWNGGITQINHWLRAKLKDWTQEVLKANNYQCAFTGLKGDLQVHHIYSFNKIVQDVFIKNKLTIKQEIKDYSEDELNIILNDVLNVHTVDLGIPMCKDIHVLFHNIYGFDNNKTQILEFQEYLNQSTVINL